MNRLKPEEINSRVIKQISKTLHNFQYIAPRFVDCCIEYCFQKKDLIHINTAGSLLDYCFKFGYSSKYLHHLIDVVIELISRDIDAVGYYLMLKCALSLCYFDRLPLNLVNYIFNIDYITKIERYIASGCKNTNTTGSIKSTLMMLNRAVCLDYPEYNIPWFHDYYQPPYHPWDIQFETFHREVQEILVQITERKNHIVANHISPYNYMIDFLIYLKPNRTSVHPLVALNDSTITKIAVLLENVSQQEYFFRKGSYEMKCRHLEILNYKVIQINLKDWNSMFMSDPMIRLSYIKDKIFSEN